MTSALVFVEELSLFSQIETAFRSLGLIVVYIMGAHLHWQSMVGGHLVSYC